MKWNIDDVPIFVAVVEQNGITAAARSIGMPKSTVSKSVSRLENDLGLRLLDRNSRNLRVTSEGETFYRQAILIMEQVRETDATMAGLNAVPAGKLTVALPPAFCQEYLAANLLEFHRQYPDIDLELIITFHAIDILREQVDIAVVVGPQNDSELISKTLLSGHLVWVTSPAYLEANSLGDTPNELLDHIQICEKRYGLSHMPVRVNGSASFIDLSKGISHVNEPISVRQAVLKGAGVSLLPDHYCRQQLHNGSLIEVYKHISFDRSASILSVVYPSRRLMSPKTRVFLEFLEHICRR